MSGYSYFADYYDGLTKNVDYETRANYIEQLVKKFNHGFGLTLDLACGTGSLTLELAKKGVDIFGADSSPDMLSEAQQKAAQFNKSILFICQKMQDIDLFGTIDTCICTLDSINHLIKREDVLKTFKRISMFMNKGGYFIFDVNTLYKHKEILGNNTFVYDTRDVYCVWQNRLKKDNATVQITLDFFKKRGKLYSRCGECFSERAYAHGDICNMLKEAGFEFVDCYGELTFEKPQEDSQRNVYIARKI